ncbi:hypothetical protein ACHHYP_16076 [Achlya hypogyna]|uniref:Protein kinase domain-containing protein n=1 Tax=Achlya hypogyna TaxID=1202772 RepID=A0A1V9Y9Q0_ACHHY|nr:hypothetical protein ACHHYP_16076 [Achlya hypogyna]
MEKAGHLNLAHRSANIVAHYKNFVADGHDHFVMEYCGHGDLFAFVHASKRVAADCVKIFLAQISSAVACRHSDLSIENTFMDSNFNCKVGGFDLAPWAKQFYMAPLVAATPLFQKATHADYVFRYALAKGLASAL